MGHPKITSAQVAAAGARWLAGEPAAAIATELGVTARTLRRRWKDAGISASQRANLPSSSPSEAPDGWDALVAEVTTPPDDPVEWATWVRRSLTAVALFRLRHPALPIEHMVALDVFRATLRDALAARSEDLVADTLRIIKADLSELEDSGPEVKPLAARKHRRPR